MIDWRVPLSAAGEMRPVQIAERLHFAAAREINRRLAMEKVLRAVRECLPSEGERTTVHTKRALSPITPYCRQR